MVKARRRADAPLSQEPVETLQMRPRALDEVKQLVKPHFLFLREFKPLRPRGSGEAYEYLAQQRPGALAAGTRRCDALKKPVVHPSHFLDVAWENDQWRDQTVPRAEILDDLGDNDIEYVRF